MHVTPRHAPHAERPTGLRLLAVLLIPVLLALHAPILAAVVPGALLTIASFERQRPAPQPRAQLVGPEDIVDLERIAAATPVEGNSRRLD
jgi:hypothetical protein